VGLLAGVAVRHRGGCTPWIEDGVVEALPQGRRLQARRSNWIHRPRSATGLLLIALFAGCSQAGMPGLNAIDDGGAPAGGAHSGVGTADGGVDGVQTPTTGEGGAPDHSSASLFEGLWKAVEQSPNPCERDGTEPLTRFVRLRRGAAGSLKLARLGLDVPKDELLDPAYEECSVTLQLEGEIASAMPYFYTPRRLDEYGLSADALQISVVHDDFSLVGEELHEHRINSADMGFGRHDCAGAYDISYLRSHDGDSPQAVPRSPLHISGDWRTVKRGASGSPLTELDVHFNQVDSSVTATCLLGHTVALVLTGNLSGSHLRGTYQTNISAGPTDFDLTFSSDELRFNGTWGKDNVWQGVW
jgi:hypothetical protein